VEIEGDVIYPLLSPRINGFRGAVHIVADRAVPMVTFILD